MSLNELITSDEQAVALFRLSANGTELSANSPNIQWLRVGARSLLTDLINDGSDAQAQADLNSINQRDQQPSTRALGSNRMHV